MEAAKFERYRSEFPVTEKFVYLDHAGIAPLSRRVEGAVTAFVREAARSGAFAYPAWSSRVVDIRKRCAELVSAECDEIAFVKSTSHGLSLVAGGLDWREGDNVVVYEKEFPSNLYPWMHLEERGVTVRKLRAREGRIEPEDIETAIDGRTRVLAVSSVQFTNGFRMDLVRAGEVCRRRGVLLCVDAIQSLGVIPVDVKTYGIDFLAADAHKWLLGPEGIGIFYCRKDLARRMDPALVGWKSVDNEFCFEEPSFSLKNNALRFEEGSLNLMGIMGLGAAVDLLSEVGIRNIEERVLGLGEGIIGEADRRGWKILTPREKRARGGGITMAGSFDANVLSAALRRRGIMVNVRAGGLRISPHFYNTEDEIDTCFGEIDKICSKGECF